MFAITIPNIRGRDYWFKSFIYTSTPLQMKIEGTLNTPYKSVSRAVNTVTAHILKLSDSESDPLPWHILPTPASPPCCYSLFLL